MALYTPISLEEFTVSEMDKFGCIIYGIETRWVAQPVQEVVDVLDDFWFDDIPF